MSESDYPTPVSQLLTLGDCRQMPDWPDYLALGLGDEHVPDLIRMARDEDLRWAEAESLAVWAPVHAWRALGQLRAAAAVEPLTRLFAGIDEFDDEWVGEELPEVMGLIGPAAIPVLATYLADPVPGLWAKIAAAQSLVVIGQQHPDARAACVATLVAQLEHFAEQDLTLNGFFIGFLIDLHAVEAAPVMARAFAADQVDVSILGDWEEAQIQLGLLDARQTPQPNFQEAHLRRLSSQLLAAEEQRRAEPRRSERQPADQRRARQKQQKQARKKGRQRNRKRK
ncbi:MAG: PBS lyase [Chloroflexi bacterium]|nr:PBS lyase [Chloroflexota bacterium]